MPSRFKYVAAVNLALLLIISSCSDRQGDSYDYRCGWLDLYHRSGQLEINKHTMSKIDSIVITKALLGADGTMDSTSTIKFTWEPQQYSDSIYYDDKRAYLKARIRDYWADDHQYMELLFTRHPRPNEEYIELECTVVDDWLNEATTYRYDYKHRLKAKYTYDFFEQVVDTSDILSIYHAVLYEDAECTRKTVYKYKKGKIYQAKEKDERNGDFIVSFCYDNDETIITEKHVLDKNQTCIWTLRYMKGQHYPYYRKTVWYDKKEETGEYIYLSVDDYLNWTSRISNEEKNGVRKTILTTREIHYKSCDDQIY